MTDENVLIVQADTAETSPGVGHPGRAALALHCGCRRYPRGQGRGRSGARRSANSRCAASIIATTWLVLPKVALPARPISEHDGWCDDPRSPTYNRLVSIPNEWSHEKMWREDGLYDLVVVVGYNDDPPEGEWGSAIFLHIARDDYAGTAGLRGLCARTTFWSCCRSSPATPACASSHTPPTKRRGRARRKTSV